MAHCLLYPIHKADLCPLSPRTFIFTRCRIFGSMRKLLFIFVVKLICVSSMWGVTLDSADNTVFNSRHSPYTLTWAAGIAITSIPRDIVEEEINRFPFLQADIAYGLPYNFALLGKLNTMILTNRLLVGLQWNYPLSSFDFAIGADFGHLLGFVTINGFDNSINSWLTYPYIQCGYHYEHVFISARAEAEYITSQQTFAGDIQVSDARNRRNGLALSVIVEQPFFHNQRCALGLKISYSDFVYQAWPAFETFKRTLTVPEVFCAFTFP
jgi:hypothetical protein